jgi:hypothetical protein
VLLRPRALAIGALIALTALVVGCGPFGGGDDEPTQGEFVAQGNEICRKGSEQFAELQKQPPRTPKEAADLTRKLIKITKQEISGLRGLDAPSDLQEPLDRYLKAREDGLAVLRKGETAAERQDATGYAQAQAEIAKGQVERAKLARAAGFTDCSRPLGSAPTPAQTPSG